MRLVRMLPERWQKLVHEAAKFGLVGAANTVINFAIFNALILTIFSNGQLKANVVATVAATTASYFMNRHWTYRDRPRSAMRREYTLFFLFNATGLVIELAVLGMAKYGLGLTGLLALNIAKVLGVGMGTVFRFWSYRTFVFRAPAVPVVAAVAAAGSAVALAPQPRVGEPEPQFVTSGGPASGDFTAEDLADLDLEAEFEVELEAELGVELEAEFAADLDAAANRSASR